MKALLLVLLATAAMAIQPSIVFILTDDQDLILGGADHMPNLKKLVADQGATLTNFFTSTPVCCPSRASIFSGRHLHNIGVRNNSIAGNCSSPYWQRTSEPNTFAPLLQRAGYTTMFAGKYLNMYGSPAAGGTAHVPPGWSRWVGLVGNSIYYDYTISIDGVAEQHGADYAKDYLTDLVANHSITFLHNQGQSSKPFFLMVSPPSCHDPTEAAPQHATAFSNLSVPRPPSFAAGNSGKEWFVTKVGSGFPMSDPNRQHYVDLQYRRRLATLLSVDDLIGRIVETLTQMDRLDSTYIVFASDNGYHLGEFNLLKDKRLPYEFDIHLPSFVRGPGIPSRSLVTAAVLNIDLFPTFLDMASLGPPTTLDGKSALPLLRQAVSLDSHSASLPPSELAHAVTRGLLAGSETAPRDFLVEYYGETSGGLPPVCQGSPDVNSLECYREGPEMARVPPHYDGPTLCSCQDVRNNTYRCLRHVGAGTADPDYVYCEFFTESPTDTPGLQPYHVEMYALDADPWQLTNQAPSLTPARRAGLHANLTSLGSCRGQGCYQR
eukprot:m.239752 g.239752  ORF g.239752 m.239752 type:complete len:549 (+) comp22808_c0_seq1:14-1660(+)